MKQFGIFLLGAARMLVILALYITCIAAFVSGDKFFIATGVISFAKISYEVYKLFRDTRNN